MSGKHTFNGAMEPSFEAELRGIEKDQLLRRLWEHDETLWPHGESGSRHIRDNLEFLRFPDMLPQFMAGGLNANQEAEQAGMTEKLLISFGSVYHFCKAALDLSPEKESFAFRFLESCHPDALRQAEVGFDPQKMFIILVNKSNYKLEDHSLFLHFHRGIASAFPQETGKHFAAATDPDSYLATMADEYHFRYLLEMPAGVQAPYCSLLFLGLFLAGAEKFDPEVLRVACREMKKQYTDTHGVEENPACELAAFLSASAKSGRKILRFLAAPALTSFANALCPLIGGSLGRGEEGLFPLASSDFCGGEREERQASYIVLEKNGESEPATRVCKERLRQLGIPFLEMRVSNPLDLLRQAFGFQLAVVLSASRLGIDPFEPPDTLKAQALAGNMISSLGPGKNALQRKPRVKDGLLQLFAEERARREISQLNLIECLRSFFKGGRIVSYASLFVFLEQRKETEEFFQGMRSLMEKQLGIPVLLAWGPRSIYSYSYLLRSEAPAGLHLVITGDTRTDVNVPGANYKFGQIYLALALGQFEALSGANGMALRLHLGAAGEEGLAALENALTQGLHRIGG